MLDKNNYSKQQPTSQEPECPKESPYFTMEEAFVLLTHEDSELMGCLDNLRDALTTPDNSYSRT